MRIGLWTVSLVLAIGGLYADSTPAPQAEAILFTPPAGWRYADEKALPPSVKVMLVGKGQGDYPPSINLGMEKYDGTLKEYLKIVKRINEEQKSDWKDLGSLRTETGPGSLSQLDIRTEWGNVRMMHLILVRDGYAYIMTTAALRDEFPLYYNDFFKAMRSVHFGQAPAKKLEAKIEN